MTRFLSIFQCLCHSWYGYFPLGRSLALPLGHETLTLQPRVTDRCRPHVSSLNGQHSLAGLPMEGVSEKAFANNT